MANSYYKNFLNLGFLDGLDESDFEDDFDLDELDDLDDDLDFDFDDL